MASSYLPKILRADPLMLHASANCGFIVVAVSHATKASSYLPKLTKATPLLLHVPASCGFNPTALSRYCELLFKFLLK